MTRDRRILLLAALLLAATVLLGVVAGLRAPVPLPVVAHFGGVAVGIASVQTTVAVLVPLALVAIVAGLRGLGRLERSAVIWALGAASPIVLFLVARLNGVADVAALVLVYASAAGGVLLRSLHRPGGSPAAIRWASVLGIVPWGVVAFTQIGGSLAGSPPSAAIRVLTLVVLAASIAEYVVAYRRRDTTGTPVDGLLLAAWPALALAVLVIATVH